MTASPSDRPDGRSTEQRVETGRPTRASLAAAVRVTGWLVAAGLPVGVAWWLLAPTVTLVWSESAAGAGWRDPAFQAGQHFAGEGTFAVLVAVGGVATAVAARRLVRTVGWPVVAALTIGGALASVVAWRTGVWLGPDEPVLGALRSGDEVAQPLWLRSTGLLLFWPVVAVISTLATVLADMWTSPDPDAHGPDAAATATGTDADRVDASAPIESTMQVPGQTSGDAAGRGAAVLPP